MNKRIILVGPAGSGKDYLREKFLSRGFEHDVSYTTRPIRKGEIPGKTYHYVSEERFIELEKAGKFLEAVQFNGWRYGTLLENWLTKDVFIKTPSGVKQLSAKDRGECLVIYLDIPYNERRARLLTRSDADSVDRRLKADERDFAGFKDFDMRIINPHF